MGDVPSKCCRSDRGPHASGPGEPEDEEASGEEEVLADKTDVLSVNSQMPHAKNWLQPGNPGESERSNDQAHSLAPAQVSTPRTPKSPRSPTSVGFSEEDTTKRQERKNSTRMMLKTMNSFDSDSGLRTNRTENIEEEDNIDHLINNVISSTIARKSKESDGISREHSFANELFRSNSGMMHFKTRQDALDRIVEHLFSQDEIFSVVTSVSNYSNKSHAMQAIEACGSRLRKGARKLINNSLFTIFFMTLTFYAIFGPDLVVLALTRKSDKPFFIANTVVFFLFLIELFLLLVGKQNYMCTITCLLDVVSVASLLSDTWFMKGDLMSQDGARVGRMARSSRMTRLARLVRVARVTRLLPRLMRLCGKQKNELAGKLLDRRLWRSFLYLDQDQDGLISYRDFKCFYVAVITHSDHMLSQSPEDLIRADMTALRKGDVPRDTANYLEFVDFRRIMLSTSLGKNLVQYHVQDVDRDEGVWTMTQKLSDNIALKVCIGLLVLIGVMDLLELDVQDRGVLQGLEQLIEVVRNEQPKLNGVVVDTKYLCEQIRIYTRQYSLLFLYLEGGTYYKDGVGCLEQGINSTMLPPFEYIKEIIQKYDLRDQEYLQNCVPDNEKCSKEVVTSMSLIDNRHQVTNQLTSDVSTTVIVIVLLLVFVYVLNLGITSFSKTLLQPLRALVDDMTAMSALELVNIDRDPPVSEKDTRKPPKVVEELNALQVACKSMRGAVKSWAKYVPPAVVERLYQSGVEAQIGVARVIATILFCDISDFEGACRGLRPQAVLDLLSQVLAKIADVITAHHGTLLEFIGDEVLACYNTPEPQNEHKFAGASTAVNIHMVIKELPKIKAPDGRETQIRCRCGVHSASVLAGNLGSQLRMKYGLLGDGINLTARMKGINSKYKTRTIASDAIISDPTVCQQLVFRPIDLVAVKGKKEPTPVNELLAIKHKPDGTEDQQLPARLSEACEKHKQAFLLYRERHFAEAKALFDELQPTFDEVDSPEPSHMLSLRCQRYIEEPPPEDWDGVERLMKK